MRDTFVLRTENKVSIDRMSNEDAGRLLKAIFAHVAGDDIDDSEEPLSVQIILPLITGQIDRSEEKYQETCAKRAEAGRKGAAVSNRQSPAKPGKIQQSPAKPGNDHHNDPDPDIKENTLKSVKEKPAQPAPTRFIAPTVEEVEEYVDEKRLDVDPQRFVDFYASKGWKVGSSPMKDWRAACRNWARDGNRRPKQEPSNVFNFDQRHTDYDALLSEIGL